MDRSGLAASAGIPYVCRDPRCVWALAVGGMLCKGDKPSIIVDIIITTRIGHCTTWLYGLAVLSGCTAWVCIRPTKDLQDGPAHAPKPHLTPP